MSRIKFFQDISKNDVATAGGKGASLGELTRVGIPVPQGFVILSHAFDRFIEENHLQEEIAARLKEAHPEDINSVERTSVVLRDVIHDHPMPADLAEEILKSYDALGAEFVAVRSSATAEDPDQMIIEAAYGLGEAIVGGLVTPDSYIVIKSKGMILGAEEGGKQTAISYQLSA